MKYLTNPGLFGTSEPAGMGMGRTDIHGILNSATKVDRKSRAHKLVLSNFVKYPNPQFASALLIITPAIERDLTQTGKNIIHINLPTEYPYLLSLKNTNCIGVDDSLLINLDPNIGWH